MNNLTFIERLLALIPAYVLQMEKVFAISINLTHDNQLVGYYHLSQCWSCGNYRFIKDEVIKQVLLTKKPLYGPWELGEIKCEHPQFDKLLETDLPLDITAPIEFDEGNHHNAGMKRVETTC